MRQEATLMEGIIRGLYSSTKPLPFQTYQFEVLQIDDKMLQKKLKKNGMVLEADVQYLGSGVKDEEMGCSRHPQLCTMCDSSSGMMLVVDLTEAGEDPSVKLAENVIGFMELWKNMEHRRRYM